MSAVGRRAQVIANEPPGEEFKKLIRKLAPEEISSRLGYRHEKKLHELIVRMTRYSIIRQFLPPSLLPLPRSIACSSFLELYGNYFNDVN